MLKWAMPRTGEDRSVNLDRVHHGTSERPRRAVEGVEMAVTAIDLRSYHQEMEDGSHTITIEVSGLRSMDQANLISIWMRDMIRANAHQIGTLDRDPPKTQ
jgi:hypothetical protein